MEIQGFLGLGANFKLHFVKGASIGDMVSGGHNPRLELAGEPSSVQRCAETLHHKCIIDLLYEYIKETPIEF